MDLSMKACITGYGLIDCLGNDLKQNFVRLLDKHNYTSDMEVTQYVKTDKVCSVNSMPVYDDRFLSNTMRMGLYAVDHALFMSNVKPSSNVAVILSSVTGGNDLRWETQQAMSQGKRVFPRKMINIPIDALASYVSQKYVAKGINLSLYSSCTTGLVTIDYAISLVDQYDYVIVGASDHGCNPLDLTLFSSLGALSSHSSPFDDNRNGFVMGDGAGVLILESEEKAKLRNAQIFAKIYKAGHASDAHNRTSPSGEGAVTSMKRALEYAGNPIVKYVNAHATSTPIGDEIEYQSILKVIDSPRIFSNKGKIGHTMGAAGIIETIYSIEAIRHQIMPHNHNLVKCSYDNKYLIREPEKINSTHTYLLNNSFGFGGKCSSQIIEVTL